MTSTSSEALTKSLKIGKIGPRLMEESADLRLEFKAKLMARSVSVYAVERDPLASCVLHAVLNGHTLKEL